jgi:hypothetical protein
MHPSAAAIVNEALALRVSQPNIPVADVLDLVMRGRDYLLDDFLGHMVPPSPFALLVAEALGNCMTAGEWIEFTANNANDASRQMWLWEYVDSVLPKFAKRYG